MSDHKHAVDDDAGGTLCRADETHPFADLALKLQEAIVQLAERAVAVGLPVVGPGRLECTYSGTHGQVLLARRLDADRVVEICRIDADLANRRATFGGLAVPAASSPTTPEPRYH